MTGSHAQGGQAWWDSMPPGNGEPSKGVVGHRGATGGHARSTAQPAAPCGVQEGDASQLSRVTVCFWLSCWLQGDLEVASWSIAWAGTCSSPLLAPGTGEQLGAAVGKQGAASLGQWVSRLPAGTSSARLLSCQPLLACVAPLHLVQANTTSHWALWNEPFCSGSCVIQSHIRPLFRFTMVWYCVSGTWRRTAACVLCTSTSDRTLAGNGSTSLRATLLTFVQALVRTSAAQTPLTARYIQYIILSGLVAMTPPSSLSLIISGLIKAAKAVQINTCKKKVQGNCRKESRCFSRENVLPLESILLPAKCWGGCCCLLHKMWNSRTDDFRVLTW